LCLSVHTLSEASLAKPDSTGAKLKDTSRDVFTQYPPQG
jgi:hypothetical protein